MHHEDNSPCLMYLISIAFWIRNIINKKVVIIKYQNVKIPCLGNEDCWKKYRKIIKILILTKFKQFQKLLEWWKTINKVNQKWKWEVVQFPNWSQSTIYGWRTSYVTRLLSWILRTLRPQSMQCGIDEIRDSSSNWSGN